MILVFSIALYKIVHPGCGSVLLYNNSMKFNVLVWYIKSYGTVYWVQYAILYGSIALTTSYGIKLAPSITVHTHSVSHTVCIYCTMCTNCVYILYTQCVSHIVYNIFAVNVTMTTVNPLRICRESGCISLYIPDDQGISWGPREVPRAKGHFQAWEGNLEVRGDVCKTNTSRLEAVYDNSIIINLSPGMYQEIHPWL